MSITKHALNLQDGGGSSDIFLSPTSPTSINIPKDSTFRILSVVDPSQIPLYIIAGPHYDVATGESSLRRYFESVLLAPGSQDGQAWWQTAQPESPLGILVSVESPDASNVLPRITELLFVASSHHQAPKGRLPTPPASSPDHEFSGHATSLQVRAIPLSSDLLYSHNAPTPPLSPISESANHIAATFLPPQHAQPTEIIHEPPTKKRRTATNTLDEASERRKAARRKGGESISAAAASGHRRSVSGSQPAPVPLQTRPLSRSPSVASSRPGSVRGPGPADDKRRSTLSRVQSLSALPAQPEAATDETIEAKNKDTISRIVMAGMRLYGLSQSKARRKPQSRSASGDASPAIPEAGFEEQEAERRQDEEYKLVYHQVFKGTCFAFRSHIGAKLLQAHSEALRETADKLLAIFCGDPLAQGLSGAPDKLTPGGRKAFGSAKVEEERSPFAVPVGQI